MRAEPKTLVRRLTPTATTLLEKAVERAASGRFYEIVVEHILLGMLEDDAGDSARILAAFEQDRGRLAVRVQRTLERMRTGNAGRPVFSEGLFEWIEGAWVIASLHRGATRLRTGELLLELVARGARYTAEVYPELEAISAEALGKKLEELVAPSKESNEVAPEGSAPAARGDGGGRGEQSALGRFTTSFTDNARKGSIDPVFGRHREIRQLVDILVRRRKNNPIIVGEPGVGKTALVEGLAHEIVQGRVPDALRDVELLGLDLGALQAGASVKGEFENRLKQVMAEVKASPKPIIMFIDEAHTIIGAGNQAGGGDAANLLKPALARGELRTIAATTWSEYKKYFEKDAALERRFQPVKVDEPGEADAVVMIRGLRPAYEKAHGVPILDEAVVAAVRLSMRYLSGRQLPDKAVDLLDTSAARVRIEQRAKPEALVALEAQKRALETEREALARDKAQGATVDPEAMTRVEAALAALDDQLAPVEAKWNQEKASVEAVAAARKALEDAPADADRTPLQRALEEARAAHAQVRGAEALVHAEVDADVVAQVVAGWTGIPAGKMRAEAMAAVLNLEEKLRQRIRGQDTAVAAVAETLRIAHAGLRAPNAPVGVLLFVGTSGVGKTETALALADLLYGGERFMTVINMSEFQEKHTVSRLIGSPPGYVGYGEGGILTEAVRQRPYSVVLLDEVEKADLDVMNLFYQVFDKGMLSDGEGRLIDFKNTIVILTSNLASDVITKLFEKDAPPTAEEVSAAIRPTLSKHFKPALLARMSIVPFSPLPGPVLREITELKLGAVAARLRSSHGIEARFEPELLDELARRCTEGETGARNVDHVLRGSLMPRLARELLERLASGEPPKTLAVGLSPSGDWRIDLE